MPETGWLACRRSKAQNLDDRGGASARTDDKVGSEIGERFSESLRGLNAVGRAWDFRVWEYAIKKSQA